MMYERINFRTPNYSSSDITFSDSKFWRRFKNFCLTFEHCFVEYGHSPAAEKAKTVNDTVKEKQDGAGDEKRSAVNVPSEL